MTIETLRKIQKIIADNRTHSARISACKKAGIATETDVSSMGTGGTGLIRYFPRLNVTRIQIGCNYGGFAPCAVLTGDAETITTHLDRLSQQQ